MNKQELIERIEGLKNIFGNKTKYIEKNTVIELVSKLDEPEAGHADEAPRYVKNILARLRELPDHDREVWLKAIMGEFEQDFSHAKWREGYEQGKFEGEWVGQQLKDADKIRQELNKPVIPQFVADWIEYCKFTHVDLQHALVVGDVYFYNYANQKDFSKLKEFLETENNQETFARAWLDGYEVEKKKRYLVKIKGVNEECECLVFGELSNTWKLRSIGSFGELKKHHTRKELEESGFGWIFSCEGIEIEEVE